MHIVDQKLNLFDRIPAEAGFSDRIGGLDVCRIEHRMLYYTDKKHRQK